MRFLFSGFFLFAFLVIVSAAAHAREPLAAALEWEAESTVPFDYPGRALPSQGAAVRVALVVAEPVAGALRVRWELDGAPVAGEAALAMTFIATRPAGRTHTVRASVRDEKGRETEDLFAAIPVVNPQVHIHALTKNGTPSAYAIAEAAALEAGKQLSLVAKAYGFPSPDPAWTWSHNGEILPGRPRSPHTLTLTTPSNPPEPLVARIEARARDSRFSGIVASREVRVEIR